MTRKSMTSKPRHESFNFEIVGLHSAMHPGAHSMFAGPGGWWATAVFRGKRVNMYRISRMGNAFWYPAGYSCLNNPIGFLGENDPWPYFTPLSDALDALFFRMLSISGSGEIDRRDFDCLPPDWRDGLWMVEDAAVLEHRRPYVVIDNDALARHAKAMRILLGDR